MMGRVKRLLSWEPWLGHGLSVAALDTACCAMVLRWVACWVAPACWVGSWAVCSDTRSDHRVREFKDCARLPVAHELHLVWVDTEDAPLSAGAGMFLSPCYRNKLLA